MNLHHNPKEFTELIIGAANELHIPTNIIEKDYFITLVLKELSLRLKNMVFKGGTSLTKCYQILERFTEDIDISCTSDSSTLNDTHKKKLKTTMIETLNSLKLKMSQKHSKRIKGYPEKYRPIWHFFDLKSYLIMIFMMSGGIWLRSSKIAPEVFIAVFYTGLGLALALAGVLLGIFFIKYKESVSIAD